MDSHKTLLMHCVFCAEEFPVSCGSRYLEHLKDKHSLQLKGNRRRLTELYQETLLNSNANNETIAENSKVTSAAGTSGEIARTSIQQIPTPKKDFNIVKVEQKAAEPTSQTALPRLSNYNAAASAAASAACTATAAGASAAGTSTHSTSAAWTSPTAEEMAHVLATMKQEKIEYEIIEGYDYDDATAYAQFQPYNGSPMDEYIIEEVQMQDTMHVSAEVEEQNISEEATEWLEDTITENSVAQPNDQMVNT